MAALRELFGERIVSDEGWHADVLTRHRPVAEGGGRAEGVPDSAFDAAALAKGAAHEREHTDDMAVAKQIAKDHLIADPDYYEKLAAIEEPDDAEPDRVLMEAGKTGVFKDRNSRAYCLRDGKRVACSSLSKDELGRGDVKDWKPAATKPRTPTKASPSTGKSAAKLTSEEAKAKIAGMLQSGKTNSEDVATLAEYLLSLTVAQLGSLKKELGLKASGAKAELAKKIAARALEKARVAISPAPPSTKKAPAPKSSKPATAKSADPLVGHPYADKSREEIARSASGYFGTSRDPDPWKLGSRKVPLSPADRQKLDDAVVSFVQNEKAKNSFMRPNIKDAFAAVRGAFPNLSLIDFQAALAQGAGKHWRLDPYTQSHAANANGLYAIPLDREHKQYLDLK